MLPVLSGVRAELVGGVLTLTGSDLDLTITVGADVNGDTDGATVLPAKLASDVVRALPPGAVTVEVATSARVATRPASPPSGPSSACG